MKDVDICLVRWVSDGKCSRTATGIITEDTTHRKGSGVWDVLVIGMTWEIGPIKEHLASPRSMLSVPAGTRDPPGRTSGTETVVPETSIAGTTALREGGEHISITGARVRLDHGLGV
jgi:hypothetical protein